MWLYDLLGFTDGKTPIKIRFYDGVEKDISNQMIPEEYKKYYVLHITIEDNFLVYDLDTNSDGTNGIMESIK